MELLTRTVVPQSERLDRAYQNKVRPPDYVDQLAVIRVIYSTNLEKDGRTLKLAVGPRIKDAVFTMRVEFPRHPRGLMQVRLTLQGSYAEQAVRDGLKVGDEIRFDAHQGGRLIEGGRLLSADSPAYATWYEKVHSSSHNEGPAQHETETLDHDVKHEVELHE